MGIFKLCINHFIIITTLFSNLLHNYTTLNSFFFFFRYIARNDEEIQRIDEKNKLPGRKNQSHASRKDILRMNKERELDDYNGCGIGI